MLYVPAHQTRSCVVNDLYTIINVYTASLVILFKPSLKSPKFAKEFPWGCFSMPCNKTQSIYSYEIGCLTTVSHTADRESMYHLLFHNSLRRQPPDPGVANTRKSTGTNQMDVAASRRPSSQSVRV